MSVYNIGESKLPEESPVVASAPGWGWVPKELDQNYIDQAENPSNVLPAIRHFNTGATRDVDTHKLKIEGFIDPLVDKRFSQYMHAHRKQADGSLRAADNWQKGIPPDVYGDSLIRHVLDFRLHLDGYPDEATDTDLEAVLCAIIFNARGYLFELLKTKRASRTTEAE